MNGIMRILKLFRDGMGALASGFTPPDPPSYGSFSEDRAELDDDFNRVMDDIGKAMVPTNFEVVSPQEYLRIAKAERHNLKDVRFIPPKPGGGGLGVFAITYRVPVLRPK